MSIKENHPEDQINLINLKLTVYFLLRYFFRFCGFLGHAIQKGRYIMLIGLLLGIGAGLGYYYQTPEYYKGTMIVTSNKLYKKVFADVIAQLNLVSVAGSAKPLSEELNVSQEAASGIIFFESENMFEVPLKEDTSTKFNQPFKIIIALNKVDSVAKLQNALLAYLNNRPFLKHIREEETKIYTAKLNQLNSELTKIDSLKTEFNRFLASPKIGATVYSSAVNPGEIYEQSIKLIEAKEKTERSLNIENYAVSLLDGIKVSRTTRTLSLVRLLLLTGALGIIAGFLISFMIELRKKVLPAN